MATTDVAESEDFVSATLDDVNEVIEDVVRAGGGSTNVLAIIQGLLCRGPDRHPVRRLPELHRAEPRWRRIDGCCRNRCRESQRSRRCP